MALLALATIAALALRENLELQPQKLHQILSYLVITIAVAIPASILLGLDKRSWRYSTMPDYFRVAITLAVTILLATLITFTVNRMENVSRSIPVLQALVALCLMIGARIAVRLRHVPRRTMQPPLSAPMSEGKAGRQTVLVVGLTTLTVLYLRSILELAKGRIRVGGIVAHGDRHAGQFVRQYQIFSPQESLIDLLRQLSVHGVFVDKIVVTLPFSDLPRLQQDDLRRLRKAGKIEIESLIEKLGFQPKSEEDVPAKAAQAPLPFKPKQASVFDIEALRVSTRRPFWRVKRAADAVLAGILLVVLAPLFVIVASLIVLTIGFPMIFWQDRPERGGNPFKLFKFRTMGAAHDSSGRPVPEDERVNAVGRFLRATRLDELPQLWNILAGEMSFVGPRPLLHADQPGAYSARLLVRPGLTGWAQVMGGRQVSAADKAALDVWYVQNATLLLDLEIVLRTVSVVLFGERRNASAIDAAWRDLRRNGLYSPVAVVPQQAEQNTAPAFPAAEDLRPALKRDQARQGLAHG